MNLKKYQNSEKRISLGYRSHHFPCPNLIEMQINSYNNLIKKQPKTASGIQEVFNEFFPISTTDKQKRQLKIVYNNYSLSRPLRSIKDSKKYEVNYEAKLSADLSLVDEKTGEILNKSNVFLTNIPLITDKGNFIINGSEKIVISQILRAPGVAFNKTFNKQNGYFDYGATIIPLHGTWLTFAVYRQNNVYLKIDRSRKIPILILLRGLGLDVKEIKDWFQNTTLEINGDDPNLKLTYDQAMFEIFHKMRPGDPYSVNQAIQYVNWILFNKRRCNLSWIGRHKMNQKLALQNRILGLMTAQDILDENNNVFIKRNTLVTHTNFKKFLKAIESGYLDQKITLMHKEDGHSLFKEWTYQKLQVLGPSKKVLTLIGIDPSDNSETQTPINIFVVVNYILHLANNVGDIDDIDDLSNRRVVSAGELIQQQLRIGFAHIEKNIVERLSVSRTLSHNLKAMIPYLPISNTLKEFFNTSQLCQFMDQTNALSEISNKRRVTVLGPGGLSPDAASIEARDVHDSHYGKLCFIKTSEGPKIGLINYVACYARVNEFGFLQSPYYKVKNGVISNKYEYLTAYDERFKIIAQGSTKISDDKKILDEKVVARINGQTIVVPKNDVEYIDVSPKQIVSVSAANIPFLENNDPVRAFMGCNMYCQAVPLIESEAPLVGTGFEKYVAKYSGWSSVAQKTGKVTFVDSQEIVIEEEKSKRKYHHTLTNYEPSNQGIPLTHTPIVQEGDVVEKGDIIADGSGISQGEVALGKNVLTAFLSYKGYNYEDAIVVSSRLIKEDVYTSLYIAEHTIEFLKTRLGDEEMTRDIPNVSEHSRRFLDENGLVVPGSEVKAGDVLVGKITPKGTNMNLSAEDRLLAAIFGKKSYSIQNNSLKVKPGDEGVVLNVEVFDCTKNDNFAAGIIKIAKVFVAQKRKIKEGDKMSGRHGNKGIIAKVVPYEDMPFTKDGRVIDIILNPLGVPSRMNIGQIKEMHLGAVAKVLGMKFAVPIFESLGDLTIEDFLKEANIPLSGKYDLFDGVTGEKYDSSVAIGMLYMMKLSHMVDDKLHARCTGPYSLITQQPLGGRANNGGQRFGEMEVWAIEAYGAANILREMLTIKSDDIIGRSLTYINIVEGKPLPSPNVPESFIVFKRELQALCFDLEYTLEQSPADHVVNNENDSFIGNISNKKDFI